jgi:hypothetical protein
VSQFPDEISSRLPEVVAHPDERISFILRFGTLHALFMRMRKDDESMLTSSKHEDRWRELCEAIIREPDSKRLMELVEKLTRELEEPDTQTTRNAAGR